MGNKITDEDRDKIIRLYKDGHFTRQFIADKTGKSISTVRRVILKYEEENNQIEDESDREENELETENNMGKKFTPKKRQKHLNKAGRKQSLNNHQKSKISASLSEKQANDFNSTITRDMREETFIAIDNIDKNISLSEEETAAKINGILYDGLEVLKKPDSVFEVGLVADRHDMYIKNYIFSEGINESLMFNFDKQYNICCKFVEDNNITNKTLVVYCTGLQSALGSIVKCCYDKKINLVLKHYNSQSHTYIPQIIFNEFGEIADTSFPFDTLRKNCKLLLSYKSSLKDILDKDKFYCVSYNEHDSSNRFKENSCYYIMTDEIEKAWEIYPLLVGDAKSDKNKDKRLSVFLSTCKINPSSGFDWGENWAKSYNYY
jgi:hypothetical protein